MNDKKILVEVEQISELLKILGDAERKILQLEGLVKDAFYIDNGLVKHSYHNPVIAMKSHELIRCILENKAF